MDHDLSTCRRMPGILVDVHGVSPKLLQFPTYSIPGMKPVDNLLKPHN
jgi:hypothetical protein